MCILQKEAFRAEKGGLGQVRKSASGTGTGENCSIGQLLEAYYGDGGKRIRGLVNQIFFSKYGGTAGRDMDEFYSVANEKIGVGILLFDRYRFANVPERDKPYTLTPKRLETILQALDKDIFRIDLCDVNRTSCGNQSALSNERATQLLELVKKKGFEAKLFSSFGDSEQSGCGMLSSSTDDIALPGNKTKSQFNKSIELLNEAIAVLDG